MAHTRVRDLTATRVSFFACLFEQRDSHHSKLPPRDGRWGTPSARLAYSGLDRAHEADRFARFRW
jgi:hypothetical protein